VGVAKGVHHGERSNKTHEKKRARVVKNEMESLGQGAPPRGEEEALLLQSMAEIKSHPQKRMSNEKFFKPRA
jgi:hypothetical protein